MFLGPESFNPSGSVHPSDKMAPYFLNYAAKVKASYPQLPVFTTGGFRRRHDIEDAISSAQCDAVGIARPAAVEPHLPKTIVFNNKIQSCEASFDSPRVEAPWLVRQVGVTALNVHMDNVGALLLVKNNCFSDSTLGLVSGTRGEVVDARMLAL